MGNIILFPTATFLGWPFALKLRGAKTAWTSFSKNKSSRCG